MIRYDRQNGLIVIEIQYSQEKFEITKNICNDYKNAVLDLSRLNCSFPELSKIVRDVLDYCLKKGIQNICIVTRPSLLSTTREYLRELSGIDNVAFFNHISAAIRYFTELPSVYGQKGSR